MIKNYERFLAMMDDESIKDVARMSADIVARRGKIGISAREALLASDDFEYVEAGLGIMDDGREVLEVGGKTIALKLGVHAERRRLALELSQTRETERREREKEPETKSVVGSESLSALVCPKCGDSLQHTAVCSKCSAGQRGYRHRYACACGAIEIISQEAL